jgi:hypothetical protein
MKKIITTGPLKGREVAVEVAHYGAATSMVRLADTGECRVVLTANIGEAEGVPVTAKLLALVEIGRAFGEAIQKLGSVPSGKLYAAVGLPCGMSVEVYQQIIQVLVEAGLVAVSPNNLLVWVGPPARKEVVHVN